MSSSRTQEMFNQLAIEVTKNYVYPGLNWEPKARSEGVLVSELLDEKTGREILSNFTKFQDAFDVMRSSQDPSKHRLVVNLSKYYQLKGLQTIADYLNENNPPAGRKSWEVKKVTKGNEIAYLLCFTNLPAWDERHTEFYKWLDQHPKIGEKFKLIKPENHKRYTLYMVEEKELLQELYLLTSQPKPSQSPKP